jgi:hypothetical protein
MQDACKHSHEGVQHCSAAVTPNWVVRQAARHVFYPFKGAISVEGWRKYGGGGVRSGGSPYEALTLSLHLQASQGHDATSCLDSRRRPNVPRAPYSIPLLGTVEIPLLLCLLHIAANARPLIGIRPRAQGCGRRSSSARVLRRARARRSQLDPARAEEE